MRTGNRTEGSNPSLTAGHCPGYRSGAFLFFIFSPMPFYVYIIRSLKDNSYYKGFTEDYERRLQFHNEGHSIYTSRKLPWELVHVEEHKDKSSALRREKNLKKCDRQRLEAVIHSPLNLLRKK
jgi:putative endonuclease